mmetsp:Transcript_116193/g.182783  ORF Transcript_116193/g.182783 Transcript_116193/m.182783 type:complete len:95 (+) Transcript_116193:168-452(+)
MQTQSVWHIPLSAITLVVTYILLLFCEAQAHCVQVGGHLAAAQLHHEGSALGDVRLVCAFLLGILCCVWTQPASRSSPTGELLDTLPKISPYCL